MVFPPSLEDLAKIQSDFSDIKENVVVPEDRIKNPVDESAFSVVASETKPIAVNVTGPPVGTEDEYLVSVATGSPDYEKLFQILKGGGVVITPTDSEETALDVESQATGVTEVVCVKTGLGELLKLFGDGSVLLQQPGSSVILYVDSSGNIQIGKTDGELGFFGAETTAKPEVPASPTVQDVVDAFVELGLISQAE